MGIDLIRFACPIVGSAFVWHLLQVFDLLAHGLAAAAIGLALTAAGLLTRNRRLLRVGLAVLLAGAIAGLAANGLKLVFRVPRPHTPGSFSFPSGHAATAAAVAAVLVRAFPPAGPLFAVVALFGGLARVYFRDHFLVDVLAGALLGVIVGIPVAHRLLGENPSRARRASGLGIAVAVLGVAAVGWLAVYETALGAHLRKEPNARPPNVAIRFGTPGARGLMREGWSGDEKWNGDFPFAWAEGTRSRVSIPPLLFGDYVARLRVLPFVRAERLSCQIIGIDFNGTRVGDVLLDRGWNDYEVAIPKRLIRPGGADNEMAFRFDSAAVPGGRRPPPGRGVPLRRDRGGGAAACATRRGLDVGSLRARRERSRIVRSVPSRRRLTSATRSTPGSRPPPSGLAASRRTTSPRAAAPAGIESFTEAASGTRACPSTFRRGARPSPPRRP